MSEDFDIIAQKDSTIRDQQQQIDELLKRLERSQQSRDDGVKDATEIEPADLTAILIELRQLRGERQKHERDIIDLYSLIRPLGAQIGTDLTDSPITIGDSVEGSESVDTAQWVRDEDLTAVDLWMVSRVGYFESGDEKLYAYVRLLRFTSGGRLYAISQEARFEVDAPTDCTTP